MNANPNLVAGPSTTQRLRGSTQLPQATYSLLQTLRPAHAKAFPVDATRTPCRPETLEDDTAAGRVDFGQRAALIRLVLGGWMEGLGAEEGKNGSHSATSTTESISNLTSSINGPLQYLRAKPTALFVRPSASSFDAVQSLPPVHLTLANGGNLDGIPLGEDDLASFLFPRILRATASLEAALICTPYPIDGATDEASQLWRDRLELRLKLEDLLATVVGVLAESAVRVEWKGKDSPAEGGIGKAREMTSDMLKLLRALLPPSHGPSPTYPRLLVLSDASKSVGRAAQDPFDPNQPSLTIRSPLHARALLLTTLRILVTITTSSPFLSDFSPAVTDIVVESWPSLHGYTGASTKGKERAHENHGRVVIETLDVVVKMLYQPISAFSAPTMELLAVRSAEVLEQRLEPRDPDAIDVEGSEVWESRVDRALARIFARLGKEMKEGENEEGGMGRLRQVLASVAMELGDKMAECLVARDGTVELKLASLFALALPLVPRPPPFAPSSKTSTAITSPVELLSSVHAHSLASLASLHPSLPFDVPPGVISLAHLAKAAWKTLRDDLHPTLPGAGTQATARKRKREEGGQPTSDAPDSEGGRGIEVAGKRKKGAWMEAVGQVLRQYIGGEELNLEGEGLETMIARLAKDLPSNAPDDAINTLKAIALLGCARDGTLSFSPSSVDSSPPAQPACSICDSWAGSTTPDRDEATPRVASRVFTDAPLKGMRTASQTILVPKVEEKIRLQFLKAVARLLRHSRTSVAALKLEAGDALVKKVFEEMEASTRTVRMAAGNVVLAIVQGHQENDPATAFVQALCQRLNVCLNHSRPAIIETTLVTLGRIARLAVPQGLLECQCLERLVARLGHSNTFLKSVARTQLEQVAAYRDVKPYALVQPHFATISPVLVNSKHTSSATLSAALDCFHQPRDSLLRITREHTLPSLVLHDQKTMLRQIAEASKLTVPMMLTEPTSAAAILAFLYMQPDEDTAKGLGVLMREVAGADQRVTLPEIMESVRVPLIYKLALELGDENSLVSAQAERGLRNVERACKSSSKKAPIDLGVVLKDSIVGILSHMNRGLNESTAHRPLRDKQRIIRSLAAVTLRVGPSIAGFSPQIMATLQSALEVEGLRSVTLHAFKCFIESLKFNEIGPFIGTTSASFIRLWSEFTAVEKAIATKTLEYIIVDNADGLSNFVQDVADLSGIPELARANKRLQDIRHSWSFSQRSDFLLVRIGSENDVVALQALKELKVLMAGKAPQLQAYAAGDSFDRSIGHLVKVLFGASLKDGPENEQIRNTAFACIGILGALDPDRFEIPPGEPPAVVLENYENHEESITFALHLIQHLLIGAYRTTNDTKHQEFLAFAIQELLSFCGFTVDLVLPSSSTANLVDSATRQRWNQLPKSVLETCGPLLGGSFSFRERTSPHKAVYPIYTSTNSYRDWIRIWANDLISKLKGAAVKRIFGAFPPVLHLEDIAVAQHLLPHLVLNALISGGDADQLKVRMEMQTVLQDQVSPTHQLSDNSRLLSAQTVFDLMDHLSRWITLARKRQQDIKGQKKQKSRAGGDAKLFDMGLVQVEGILQDIPHILVGQAALTCKAYARSLLNFESHIVAQRSQKDDLHLQEYYENLHECYADLDEPDGMEGISTKIVAPSVLHQIREHESTGRWTSAQSCWEVKLQQTPDEPTNHIGLLRCLRNLGHYDSMRTHIVGILHSRNDQADWDRILAPFSIEASLIVGDWEAVEDALRIPDIDGPEVSFGRVISAMRQDDAEQLSRAFSDAREQLGSPIVAAGRESYRRVYDSVVHLHILHELEAIYRERLLHPSEISDKLTKRLASRLESTSPAFRAREPVLNMRRTAFRLVSSQAARVQIGNLWLETSKIARKAGHAQTAYSAILQARDLEAPYVFVQSAKLLKAGDEEYKAIQNIDYALQSLIPTDFGQDPNNEAHVLSCRGPPTLLAKAALRRARWMHEAGRLEQREIIERYQESSRLAPDWESPYYFLGHYWDLVFQDAAKKPSKTAFLASLPPRRETVKQFSHALAHGTKYIYQTMPRMLTIWFELGEQADLQRALKLRRKNPAAVLDGSQNDLILTFNAINKLMERNIRKLPVYQWLTVLPQLVSRILHPNDILYATLEKILLRVFASYPQQAFWSMVAGAKSTEGPTSAERSARTRKVFHKAAKNHVAEPGAGGSFSNLIDASSALVDALIGLCTFPLTKDQANSLSMKKTFPSLYQLAPIRLMIPIQAALNVSLPSDASQMLTHKPFPDRLVVFHKFDDAVQIMSSLQRPRKISVWGDDGNVYGFLCKEGDDLRKDSRLMEFVSFIIKLLKKDSEARKRKLSIRPYSVVPLNEKCGLIEWVPNILVLRGILTKAYLARGIPAWNAEMKVITDSVRLNEETVGERFEKEVLARYPPVFHEWFLETFPEPSAWLRARLAYSRTNAVMCIVGFVLGLGDRHCENILVDETNGDTVHVDFNCLFDKGQTFDIRERIPFRLTNNIIDGMGVMGVEGVYRIAAEITLRVLRDSQDGLMSVLETFLHDPLIEWDTRKKTRDKSSMPQVTADTLHIEARKHLEPVGAKLRGLQVTSDKDSRGEKDVSVGEQVERLIREAKSSKNLGLMYAGWCAWF